MGHKRKREQKTAIVEETMSSPSKISETQKKPAPEQTIQAEEGPKIDPKHQRTLFVRSLAPETTTDDLTELFSQSYPIKHAIAVLDSETKKCKGYGFVTFPDAEDAQRAKEEFSGSDLHGKKISIDIAEPRHRDLEKGSAVPAAALELKAAREKQKKEAQAPPRLIVRNLPWSIKEPGQLAALFQSYGKVKNVILPTKKPGLMSGFGIVLMRGRRNAEKAIEGVNGKEVDGRQIAVDWAVDKETWQNTLQNAEQEEKEQEGEEGQDKSPKKKSKKNIEVQNADTLMREGSVSAKSENEDEEDEDDDVGADEADERDGDDSDGVEDDDEEEEEDYDEVNTAPKVEDYSSTLFIRNLPFTTVDEDLEEHFSQFGPVRYARVVMDHATDRSKGTGFVRFVNQTDSESCLKGAPKSGALAKKDNAASTVRSVLQDVDADPTGKYTMEGRVLQISRAVDRTEAARLTAEGVERRDRDKRCLFLLTEGTIPSNSPLYQKLSASEIAMREASVKQRKALIQSNPSLHLSLTRLSIRNIPRSVSSKELKALGREAIVYFAKDVQAGVRQPLSKEELVRGGDEMRDAEKERKRSGKGIVKQAKIVFENREGSGKVSEASGAGRSRGYGFIEYHTHRAALMGLRFLNGYAVTAKNRNQDGKQVSKEDVQDRKKRLIVEFAIENAQVVHRRKEMEVKARERAAKAKTGDENEEDAASGDSEDHSPGHQGSRKRRRVSEGGPVGGQTKRAQKSSASVPQEKDDKLAKRQQIIAKKRMIRRNRKKSSQA